MADLVNTKLFLDRMHNTPLCRHVMITRSISKQRIAFLFTKSVKHFIAMSITPK